MAQYHYDEGGNMAAYFLITFLSLVLIPMTLSLFNSSSELYCFLSPEQIVIVPNREDPGRLSM